jgi:hypothetical protein
VFTDYEVQVSEVLKNNLAVPVESGGVVTVTKSGGSVVIDNILVTTLDEAVLPLPRDGHEVLLFLAYVPATDSYESVSGFSSFVLSGQELKPLCARPLTFEQTLISTIERAAR